MRGGGPRGSIDIIEWTAPSQSTTISLLLSDLLSFSEKDRSIFVSCHKIKHFFNFSRVLTRRVSYYFLLYRLMYILICM